MNIILFYTFLPQWASNLFPTQFLLSIKSQDFSLDLELGDHLDYNHQEKKLGDPPSQPAYSHF